MHTPTDIVAQPNEEGSFASIYQLAIVKDEKKLRELVNLGFCIDVNQDFSYHTVVSWLASQRKHEAVEFLIGRFGVSRDSALMGYAIIDDTDRMSAQLEEGAKRVSILIGYAIARKTEKVDDMIKEGGFSQKYIALAYAIGDRVDQLENQIAQANKEKVQGILDFAVLAFAIVGNEKQVEWLIKKGARRCYALFGYGKGNHLALLEKQIDLGENRSYAIQASSMAGIVEQTKDQIKKGKVSLSTYFKAFFLADHQKMRKLLDSSDGNANALHGYARGYHVDQVNYYSKMYGLDLISAVNGYYSEGYITKENILYLMTFTDDKKLRELLWNKAIEHFPVLKAQNLLRKAEKLNELIRKDGLTFKQARFYLDVVRDYSVWLFLIKRPLGEKGIVGELYFYMLEVLMKCKTIDAEAVYKTGHQRVHNRLSFFHVKSISTKDKVDPVENWDARSDDAPQPQLINNKAG